MPAIGQRNFNPVRAVDDVAVGEGETVLAARFYVGCCGLLVC
jgi:hypothetical protein